MVSGATGGTLRLNSCTDAKMTTARRARPAGLMERTIAEAIDAVAAPPVRDRVLAAALRDARLSRLPERGPAVGAFVEGPLFEVLARVVGETAAMAVRDELAVVAEIVADDEISEVRRSWPVPAELAAAGRAPWPMEPVPSDDPPLVMVASSSAIAIASLKAALRGTADIEVAGDVLTVVEGLERSEQGAIVVDCRHPTVQVEILLALEPELPPGTRVLLWGEEPDFDRHLALLGTDAPPTWFRCGADATAEDVAAACRALLLGDRRP